VPHRRVAVLRVAVDMKATVDQAEPLDAGSHSFHGSTESSVGGFGSSPTVT
jgi:hypothetical protein